MARLVLVLGGVRSGKSRLAEQLAGDNIPVSYLATARAGDAEMARRIAEHRLRRPASWHTIEEAWDVPTVIGQHTGPGSLLLDCLSLWLTNLLVGLPEKSGLDDAGIRAAVDQLIQASTVAPGTVVVVSNETGCGIIPDNPLARRFGDLLGEANQRLAQAATEVHWCVAGIPLRIKGNDK